ncbi:MAG: tRNA threonylcarbamoyladenosine biosynthesis protein RimN [Gammaproteobacteria bacterium SG8_31]|jgi:L-threonylcarbamoyladenylate synthase|nr:MAG: tRNA threonylcarbamoyladenosine biosynthesis protein RimN [Gammaproteobacteria bacterium SG8_31]
MVPSGPLRYAARVLQAGGVVAYPTEAVYGLGCDPLELSAVERILACKDRSAAAGLILLADEYARIEPFVDPSEEERQRMFGRWPGPVTWVCTASSATPDWLTGGRGTVAVRVTAHENAAALCRAAGMAIVSTSANRSGRPPCRSALQVRRRLFRHVDYVLPGATGGRSRPSEIRDARTGAVLRPG